MFTPLAAVLALRFTVSRTTAIVALLTLAIEVIQIFVGRFADLGDVMLAAIGALVVCGSDALGLWCGSPGHEAILMIFFGLVMACTDEPEAVDDVASENIAAARSRQ